MIQQLAHECFIRRIATITLMEDLLLCDLEIFVDLVSADPYKVASAGGLAKSLEERGSRTVWINEKDMAAIWAKRGVPVPQKSEESWDGVPLPEAGDEPESSDTERTIKELLRLMSEERRDARYQQLGRELVERFRERPDEVKVLPVLEELLNHHQAQQRSLPQREYALFTLERVADVSPHLLLDHLENREDHAKETIHRVFAALGVKGAYWIIQRISLAEGVFERKLLAAALVRLGQVAVAPVAAMMKDQRWYVVRNMVTILGELRAPEAVIPLRSAVRHSDQRVRKEAIRALMRIGGEPAEATLMTLLEEPDDGIVKHAILSLGLMRSRQAVPVLIRMLERRDLLLKTLAMKKELAMALGRIGDRRATPTLVKILGTRGWPVLGKWQDLKLSAATALGILGDEAALPALAPFASDRGLVAEACREAVDAIERVSGDYQ
jgi:HEAT repeat protein